MKIFRCIAACLIGAGAGAALAQSTEAHVPQNVLQLSASGTVEVQQDLLSISLVSTREGPDAPTVQSQLKNDLDTALAQARQAVQPGQLDARTGHFGLFPRYGNEGKIKGWQGQAELVIEGRDFQRVTQTAGRITQLNVNHVSFGLSREQRAKAEAEAQAMAIQTFKQKATELAKGFGFGAYTLREVTVHSSQGDPVQPRMMAMGVSKTTMSADASVPVEAGKASVVVNISGSVQLK